LSKLFGVAALEKVWYCQPRRPRSTATIETTKDSNEGGAPTRSWKRTCVVHGMNKRAEDKKEQGRKEHAKGARSSAVPTVGCRPAPDGASRSRKIDRRFAGAPSRKPWTRNGRKGHPIPVRCRLTRRRQDRMGDPLGPSAPESGAAKSNAVHPGTLFDQLLGKVNERRRHQLAMEAIGASIDTREMTAFEIKGRLVHLRRLDPQQALAEALRLAEA
jgi:hypothetical protein